MLSTLRKIGVLLFLCLPAAVSNSASATAVRPAAIPESFELFFSARGVAVYGNESEVGAEEYVQIVDLSAGARLHLWHGAIVDSGVGEGQYGGASPRIERHYLPDVWLALEPSQPQMLCLANGQFFRDTINGMWVNPTELAFPLKSDGVVISEGYEQRRFRWHRAMLEIWDEHAAISAFSRLSFNTSSAPDIVVGLGASARVRPTEELGRTFIGLGDGDGDGLQERLFIYSGAAATQAHAAAVLREFGAQAIMMLDGGGSAQLSCGGAGYIRRVRPLPQMIATIAAQSQTPTQSEITPTPEPYLKFFEETLSRWLRLLDVKR